MILPHLLDMKYRNPVFSFAQTLCLHYTSTLTSSLLGQCSSSPTRQTPLLLVTVSANDSHPSASKTSRAWLTAPKQMLPGTEGNHIQKETVLPLRSCFLGVSPSVLETMVTS